MTGNRFKDYSTISYSNLPEAEDFQKYRFFLLIRGGYIVIRRAWPPVLATAVAVVPGCGTNGSAPSAGLAGTSRRPPW